MQKLITELQERFPNLRFVPGKQFSWSPENSEIIYLENTRGTKAIWSLLHETGHALLQHTSYKADFELLKLEVAAWEKARELARELSVAISEDHIQDCLDTYRDWLHKRSLCPNCFTVGIQQGDFVHYRCYNCHTMWRVSTNRFCRSYRRYKGLEPSAVA